MRLSSWRLVAALLLTTLTVGASPLAAAAPAPAQVQLPLSEYEALMRAARQTAGPQASWRTGRVAVTLPAGAGGFARVEIDSVVRADGERPGPVWMLPGDVALERVLLGGQEGALSVVSGAYYATLTPGEETQVKLVYRARIREADDGGHLALLPLPPLPSSQIVVTRPGGVDDVALYPSGEGARSGGRLQTTIAATSAIALRWGSGGGLARRADYRLQLRPGSDGADVDATFHLTTSAPASTLKLAPASLALVGVSEGGEPLITRVVDGWHTAQIRRKGEHIIRCQFRVGIDRSQGQPKVALTLPRTSITYMVAVVPGERTVSFEPEVPVKLEVAGEGETSVTTASAYLPPSDGVTIRWTEPRSAPEKVVSANTETYQLVEIEEGVVRSKVQIRYEIIRGAVKELAVALPEDATVVLYRVNGEGIEDWRTFAATEDAPRQARIYLGSEREGSYVLELELEQVVPTTVGATLQVPVVRPLGAARERGVVALFDGDKVSFAPSTTTMARTGEDALPAAIRQTLGGDIVTQAFKHVGPPTRIVSAVAAATVRDIHFDARVEAVYLFQHNALEVHATVAVDVKSGRTSAVVLSFPVGLTVGRDVSAPSLKSAEWLDGPEGIDGRRRYEIQLTRPLEGTFDVVLQLERILPQELGALTLPDIQVLGADVQKGVFGVATESGIEVTQAEAEAMSKVDVERLPNSVRLRSRADLELGFSYSFASKDDVPALSLRVKRHKTVETLAASVVRYRVQTTAFEEGQVVGRAVLTVQNKDQAFLRLGMPAGVKILAAAVDGGDVEPISDDDGALKIRLPKQRESEVVVSWLQPAEELGPMSELALAAPRPFVFVQDLEWRVLVPARHSVYGEETTLRALDAAVWDGEGAGDVTLMMAESSGMAGASGGAGAGEMKALVFGLSVYDGGAATTPPLTVDLSLLATPGPWLNTVLLLLSMLALGLLVWRRVRERRGALLGGALAALGLGAIAFKMVGWGIGGGELMLLAAVLAGAAAAAWVQAKNEEMSP